MNLDTVAAGNLPATLTTKQVCELFQISQTKLWRLSTAGHFPEPLPSFGRTKRWSTATVLARLNQQAA